MHIRLFRWTWYDPLLTAHHPICQIDYLSNANIGTEPIIFEGRTAGMIVPARGPGHFGWDAVFEPLGTGLTYVI